MTKILVIEDEAPLLEEILEWLGFEDYEAFGATDGVEGVETAIQHLPDLIVCDVMMPRLDGYGTLLELRANPLTLSIPFIFLTAKADRESVRHGMVLGADDYLTKPFTRQELFQAIQSRLEKRIFQEEEYQQQMGVLHQALDQEREQRLVKTRMVSMFSHDFRNSLAAILSSNSLLRDYADRMTPERRLIHMNQIESSVRLLLHMLDEMLMAGQMETGNLVMHPEYFDIAPFLQTIVAEFRLIDSDEHSIQLECQDYIPVHMDKNLFRQIIANLLSNAIKYSRSGTEITVKMEQTPGCVVLHVQDQGIGIPEEDQAGLFEAFRRASNADEYQGTGLGLAIVQQAVNMHGGDIHVHSKVGAGSTFSITLPCEPKEVQNS